MPGWCASTWARRPSCSSATRARCRGRGRRWRCSVGGCSPTTWPPPCGAAAPASCTPTTSTRRSAGARWPPPAPPARGSSCTSTTTGWCARWERASPTGPTARAATAATAGPECGWHAAATAVRRRSSGCARWELPSTVEPASLHIPSAVSPSGPRRRPASTRSSLRGWRPRRALTWRSRRRGGPGDRWSWSATGRCAARCATAPAAPTSASWTPCGPSASRTCDAVRRWRSCRPARPRPSAWPPPTRWRRGRRWRRAGSARCPSSSTRTGWCRRAIRLRWPPRWSGAGATRRRARAASGGCASAVPPSGWRPPSARSTTASWPEPWSGTGWSASTPSSGARAPLTVMRIFIPIHQADPGGIMTVVRGLAGALPDVLDPDDDLVLYGDPASERWGKVQRAIDQQWRAARAARGADLVHLGDYRPLGVSRVPFVITVHDLTFLDRPDWYPRPIALYKRAMFRAALAKRPAGVVCVSEHTRKRFAAHAPRFPAERVWVIHPGLAPPPAAEPSEGDAYFLTVGAIEPRRNHLMVLAAFQRAAPGLRWVVVGREHYRGGAIAARLRAAPGVDVRGWV